jgi:hypothetical protein
MSSLSHQASAKIGMAVKMPRGPEATRGLKVASEVAVTRVG